MKKLLLLITLLFPRLVFAQGIAISALPSTNALTASAIAPIVDNGATYKSAISNYFRMTGDIGAWQLPNGTTAQRPSNSAGLIRYNSTTGRFEHNIGSSWENWVRLSGDTMTGTLTAIDFIAGTTNFVSALNLKSPLISPVFTGDPQVPNVVLTDSDTTIANTAFVKSNITLVAQAPVGTMVESGIASTGVVPATSDTTGTNFVASPLIVSVATNILNRGGILANYVTSTNVVTGSTFTATGTGADQLPSGTTAQQPANNAGLIRWNTDTARFELNIGSGWKNLVRLDGDTMTGPLIINPPSIGTFTPGLLLSNTGPATATVTATNSPYLYFSGGAWLSTPSSNAPVTFRMGVVPLTGTSSPGIALWKLESSLNGGAFANALSYGSDGVITSAGYIKAGSGTGFQVGTASILQSSANGAIELKNNNLSGISTVQANIPQITKTANYVATATDSGLMFNNTGAAATNRIDLPTAAAGMHFWAYEDANFACRLQATGSDVIRDAATVSPGAGGITLNAVGSIIHIVAIKAGLWVVENKNGTFVGPN